MLAPRLSLALVPFLTLALAHPAAADAPAILGHAPGLLAVREGESPWRILHAGESLPGKCEAQSAAGPCIVRLGEATLHLAPESRLELDAGARRIALRAGRAFLEVAGGDPWRIETDDDGAEAAPGAAAELAIDPGHARRELRLHRPGDERKAPAWAAARAAPQGLGQLVVKDAQSGSRVRLNVARYHVHVVLQPPVALVQIDQSFYNPYGRQEEGQFVFNLPQGASVSRFAMYVTPSQLVEGELIERERAAGIYQQIVSRQRDPAILEQIGPNLFKMRVFPVFARDTKRILLDYTLPLESEGGACHFQLPLLSDLAPIWDFQLSGAIRGAAGPEAVASLSHPEVAFEARPDGSIGFSLRRANYRPAADFAVSFSHQARPALRTYLAEPLPAPQDDRGRRLADAFSGRRAMYFMAEVPGEGSAAFRSAKGREASLPQAGEGSSGPADVLVLADTSSGIEDLAPVRRAVRHVVSHLGPEDRLRLLCVDVAPRPVHEGWLRPASEEAAAALTRLDEEFALGGTNLHACIRDAVEGFDRDSDRRRLVVYVGDGQDEYTGSARQSADSPAVLPGATTAETLDVAGAAFFGVCVRRSDSGHELLEHLAGQTGGLAFDLTAPGRGPRELFRWLLAGLPSPERIVQVEVEGAAPEDLYYPTAWTPGTPLCVYGRAAPARSLEVRITTGRGERTKTTAVKLELPPAAAREDPLGEPRPGHDGVFVGRLWAQKRLDQLRASGFDDDASRARLIALSQEWSLLSPLTAFLVLESEEDYARWNIDRRARRRYWRPADTRPEAPLPPEWLAAVSPPETPKERLTEEQFRKGLEEAKAALAAGDAPVAHGLLKQMARDPLAARSLEFADLQAKAALALRAQTLRESLGTQRGLFDPSAGRAGLDLRPSVLPLVSMGYRTSADFLRRHPCAEKLLQDVPLEALAAATSVEELADMIRERCGANVTVDRKALRDVGLDQARIRDGLLPHASGKVSLRAGVKLLLRQLDLVLVEEPHRLVITTPEEAESRMATEVYPLADLLFTDRVAELGLLVDPFADRAEAARRRIEARLRKPMTFNFVETPLADVVRHFARFVDGAMVFDAKALEDVGLGTDTPVTASGRDVPAKEALRWVLEDLDLDYMFQHEALVITTPEEAESRMEVRLHSGRGVVYEHRAPAVPPWQRWQDGFGGMGGMAFGGGMGMAGMGGFAGGAMGAGMAGGGMGGMGMGGGMGGPSTPFVVGVIPVVDGRGAGLSSGGDPAAGPEGPPPPDAPDAAPVPGLADPGLSAPQAETEHFQHDVDSAINLVTSTVRPTTWDDVGGPGSIAFFPYTLDFVFAQTRQVHEEVEALFDRLRRMPPALGPKQGIRPATLPKITPDTPGAPDFDSFIDLITCTVWPTTWDDVGGPGSIAPDWPRAALIISQTGDVHDELWRLLVLLRRSRYEAVRGTRPWETAGEGPGGLVAAGFAGIDLSGEARLSRLPPPKPEELAALRVRREPAGQQTWRRVEPARGGAEALTVRAAGERLELVFPHGAARIEGDQAAVAWPDLLLVEHCLAGEALRQAADAWLPWLPHRTSEQLARVFEVRSVAFRSAKGRDDALSEAGEGRRVLRLIPAGFSAEEPDIYIEAAFSAEDGLPVAWETYAAGKLTGRLRFSERAGQKDSPYWRRVVLEDAAGKELARWEMVEAGPEKVADEVASHSIPELMAGWDGYVQLDRRADKPAVDPALREALDAVRAADWHGATRHLNVLAETHPGHPLVQVLYAWCFAHDPSLGSREHVLALLREAASKAPGAARFVAEGHFQDLTPGEVYAIALLQPEATRTAEDCDRLCAAAVAAGKPEAALRHAEAAIALPAPDPATALARQHTRVELLLKQGRAGPALMAVGQWTAGAERSAEDLAAMAELLARYAQAVPADELFAQALARPGLPDDGRYRLLRRRADVREGFARLETLVEAALLQPAGSEERGACVEALLGQLNDPADAESAGRLAAAVEEADLKTRLLLRQAELSRDPALRADIVWQVHCAGRLDAERLFWACALWNQAGQPERVIAACETRLRAGKPIAEAAAAQLAPAYRAAGRAAQAARAETRDAPAPADLPAPGAAAVPGTGMGMF